MTALVDAPFMRGRMSPGIFTYFVGRKPRFPGDPWPEQIPLPSFYRMHSNECRRDPNGSVHGIYRDKNVAPGLRMCNEPAQAELFAGRAA